MPKISDLNTDVERDQIINPAHSAEKPRLDDVRFTFKLINRSNMGGSTSIDF